MKRNADLGEVTGPVKKGATYADLEALPRNVVGQLIDGELIAFPRPAADHAVVSSALGALLGAPFQFGRGGPGGWWILDQPELHFGENVLVPDLASWRRTRLPQPAGAFFTVAPDWLCEVLSPSTARVDRVRKLPLYARAGVEHVWLIDPRGRTLEALRRDGDEWRLLGTWSDEDRVTAAPFDAVEFELRLLWPFPRPPESP